MMWGLLNHENCAISEEQVLATLDLIQGTLCNRTDLIPSAEKLIPSLVLDVALLLGKFCENRLIHSHALT
jgi:hypothetical protein